MLKKTNKKMNTKTLKKRKLKVSSETLKTLKQARRPEFSEKEMDLINSKSVAVATGEGE